MCYHTYNIGDDIQTIAVMKFLPRVDFYVYRDNMWKVYDAEFNIVSRERLETLRIATVVNGWFIHDSTFPEVDINSMVFPHPHTSSRFLFQSILPIYMTECCTLLE